MKLFSVILGAFGTRLDVSHLLRDEPKRAGLLRPIDIARLGLAHVFAKLIAMAKQRAWHVNNFLAHFFNTVSKKSFFSTATMTSVTSAPIVVPRSCASKRKLFHHFGIERHIDHSLLASISHAAGERRPL